ncbi:alkaline shock response membrane anchor protein AmaP [Weissella confusa]|uniref:alkaline shock response membrane anchor protein AmaP n=1 Tax=Weissella confusa TaxID=1583 RepID=UPI0018F14495|nr:alkaline shock response membrane anchor protein AmaP [Weissella confusa]MBJ7676655.1 alkaline shock response membrane anchor protein AmaP [Weissella confusa]
MKRLYKVLLVIILLIYLISISTIIWPDIITKILSFLDHINLHSSLSEQMLLRYNELFILGLTSVILIVVIALPRQRKSILLINSGKGTLSLGNEGISSFIKTQLSGEGLSNIQVNIKNTKPVSYTHLRAHETLMTLVCRLLLEKKKQIVTTDNEVLPQESKQRLSTQ